ncbi:MAG: tetratricopeptide repeat protein [Terriglobia bacterium]
MRRRPVVPILMLIIAMILTLSMRAQQKPFTQEQISNMVRDGLGDETGAKAIEQRGIDFAPAEDFLQSLKAAGATDAFLAALQTAKRSTAPATPAMPATPENAPLDEFQVMDLLTGNVPNEHIIMLIQQRGDSSSLEKSLSRTDIPFADWLKGLGGNEDLIAALRSAKVFPNEVGAPERHARIAEGDFAQRLKQDPRNHAARVALALALVEEGGSNRLVVLFRDAVALEPNDAWSHFMLGEILFEKREEGAMAQFRRASQLKPDYAEVHNRIGSLLQRKGDLDGAIVEYRKELRLNPNNAAAHTDLCTALGQKGDWDGAVAEYHQALRLDPEEATVLRDTLVMNLMLKGDFDGEIALYRDAIRWDPNDDWAHERLGLALGRKDDWDGEIAEEREALRLNPNNENAHEYLGAALGHKDDWDGMITEEREALRLNPNNAAAHNGLGFALHKKGDRRGALEEFRAAYTLDSKNAFYKQAYERMLQQLSQ